MKKTFDISCQDMHLPIAIRRNDIVDPELLADLLNAQMRDIRIELLRRHGRCDGSRQIHQARRLIISSVAPPVALAALLRAIRVVLWFFTLRTATALGFHRWCAVLLWPIFTAEASTSAERDGVCTSLSCVVSPRHLVAVCEVVVADVELKLRDQRAAKGTRLRFKVLVAVSATCAI